MMYGSQDHALNFTKTCLNLDMFWNLCKILQSPSDGHSLLHSTISSVKSELKPHNDLHTGYLLHMIKNEIWTNPKRYSCFIKNNGELCLYTGFHEYALHKRYDSNPLWTDIILYHFFLQNWRALRWLCPEIKPVLLTSRSCTWIWWWWRWRWRWRWRWWYFSKCQYQ